jgi:monothiol glutaredoxin
MIANFIRSAVGVRRLNPAVFFYFSDS